MTSSKSHNASSKTPGRNKSTKKAGGTKPNQKDIKKALEQTTSKAEEYARDPEKARRLINKAVKKAQDFEKKKGPLAEVWSYLTALFRLLQAYIRREYRDIAWGSIVLVTIAIIYLFCVTHRSDPRPNTCGRIHR